MVDKNVIYGTLVVGLVVGVVLGGLVTRATEPGYREVMAECLIAKNEINGASEQRCGELQDKTGTEFLCGKYGCWLEVKEY